MAVKKSAKTQIETVQEVKPVEVAPVRKYPKWLAVAAGVFIFLVLYWYKTNSWPVVAFVNGTPILRSQVMTELYKQGGEQVVDSLITESLIKKELKTKGIEVNSGEIDEKINQIKTSLGEEVDLDQALADRGMTMKDLRDQISLQVGIEKAVSDKISVNDEEVTQYVTDNGDYLPGNSVEEKTQNAKETLEQGKLQEVINTWIEELRTNGKVWRVGKDS